jgi:hypothetical protein
MFLTYYLNDIHVRSNHDILETLLHNDSGLLKNYVTVL